MANIAAIPSPLVSQLVQSLYEFREEFSVRSWDTSGPGEKLQHPDLSANYQFPSLLFDHIQAPYAAVFEHLSVLITAFDFFLIRLVSIHCVVGIVVFSYRTLADMKEGEVLLDLLASVGRGLTPEQLAAAGEHIDGRAAASQIAPASAALLFWRLTQASGISRMSCPNSPISRSQKQALPQLITQTARPAPPASCIWKHIRARSPDHYSFRRDRFALWILTDPPWHTGVVKGRGRSSNSGAKPRSGCG
jgi:hypothetical protein